MIYSLYCNYVYNTHGYIYDQHYLDPSRQIMQYRQNVNYISLENQKITKNNRQNIFIISYVIIATIVNSLLDYTGKILFSRLALMILMLLNYLSIIGIKNTCYFTVTVAMIASAIIFATKFIILDKIINNSNAKDIQIEELKKDENEPSDQKAIEPKENKQVIKEINNTKQVSTSIDREYVKFISIIIINLIISLSVILICATLYIIQKIRFFVLILNTLIVTLQMLVIFTAFIQKDKDNNKDTIVDVKNIFNKLLQLGNSYSELFGK